MSIASQERSFANKTVWFQFVPAWLLGSIAAYFLTSFFSNFYPQSYQFIFLGLFFQVLCGAAIFPFVGETVQQTPAEKHIDWIAILILLIAFALSISALIISWQYPGLFHRRILFMDLTLFPYFVLLSFIALGGLVVILGTLHQGRLMEGVKQTRFFKFIQVNLPGLLLAMLFLFIYLVFAESINFPQFRTLDQYFDTDISVWLQRLTSPSRQDVSMVRAVHPAILLFFRPLVWFLSIFLHGDRLQAVFLMNALAGASCVLLTWLIMKRATGNTAYSLIIGSLLGTSASHLLLSSMFETYIYSALAILFFIFLLCSEHTSLRFTVPVGILVFGITVTNIVQTGILYLFKHPRFKALLKYALIVVLVTALLNVLQVWLYPKAQSLFRTSDVLYEQRYIFDPFEFSWRSMGRFSLTVRAILLYGMVAPTPFILTKELGMDVPNFRTYQILLGEFHVAGYRGLADVTVKFWILLLGVAGIIFLVRFFRYPKQELFPLSLLLCLGFSLLLHLVYGDDPLLYSPNWTYALVLFLGLTLQHWADRRWLQLGLIIFLILIMTTNLGLIHQIMEASAPFYSTGN